MGTSAKTHDRHLFRIPLEPKLIAKHEKPDVANHDDSPRRYLPPPNFVGSTDASRKRAMMHQKLAIGTTKKTITSFPHGNPLGFAKVVNKACGL